MIFVYLQKKHYLCNRKQTPTFMKAKVFLLLFAVVAFLATGCEPVNTPKEVPYFSVSSTQKIAFSPGNLQYKPSKYEWRFAPNQYDYIGKTNINISETYAYWIDLFVWGTGDNPIFTSNNFNDFGTFVDWGINCIGDDNPNTWRTLTEEEWNYLIFERPKARALIGIAQVNNVNGLILLPDNWVAPDSVLFISGMHRDYSGKGYKAHQSFNGQQWSLLEQNGAIFLPAAGMREGYYWTATIDGSDPCFLYFCEELIYTYSVLINRLIGKSVRLVKNL